MKHAFILRRLDGLYLHIINVMTDVVSGREFVRSRWVEEFRAASVFFDVTGDKFVRKYPEAYKYYISGKKG